MISENVCVFFLLQSFFLQGAMRRTWSEWVPLPSALISLIVEYKRCATDASNQERFHAMFLELDYAIVVLFEPSVSIGLHFGSTCTYESLYNDNTFVRRDNTQQQWFEIAAPLRAQPQIMTISSRMTEQEACAFVFEERPTQLITMTYRCCGVVNQACLNERAREILCRRVRELMREF